MKKGFTLIELLAVIVMLAIIALIAVPIVINIINDSKKSSGEQNVELYRDTVQKAIAKYQMNHPSFNPSSCDITSTGNIKCGTVDIPVDMKGAKPTSGKIIIENNKVNLKNIELDGKIYYKAFATLISDSDNNKEVSIGDKYTYDVNKTDTFIFYVISINNDNTVNLIMDRNICNDGTAATEQNKCTIAWRSSNADNSNGPVTAMQGLYNATKNWINVLDMNLDYLDEGHIENSNYGYEKIIATQAGIKIIKRDGTELTRSGNQTPVILYEDGQSLKARLPKYSEIENYYSDGRHCSIIGKCPAWLVDNLEIYSTYYSTNTHIQGIKGYWLLSSDSNNNYGALYVYSTGNLGSTHTFVSSDYGVRPVITVPLSDLQ